MNRQQIRFLVRSLIDEQSAAPEGLFSDTSATETNLNDYINLAIHNVQMELLRYCPRYWRKTFTMNTTLGTASYAISTAFSVTDFMRMEDIFNNRTGESPAPLLHIEPDQQSDNMISVGASGTPRYWWYEGQQTIVLHPTPNATETAAYKAFYYYRIPDLTHDTSDVSPNISTPSLPLEAHILVAYDVANQLHIVAEEEAADIQKEKARIMNLVAQIYGAREGTSWLGRPSLKETMARGNSVGFLNYP